MIGDHMMMIVIDDNDYKDWLMIIAIEWLWL